MSLDQRDTQVILYSGPAAINGVNSASVVLTDGLEYRPQAGMVVDRAYANRVWRRKRAALIAAACCSHLAARTRADAHASTHSSRS